LAAEHYDATIDVALNLDELNAYCLVYDFKYFSMQEQSRPIWITLSLSHEHFTDLISASKLRCGAIG
jgi:hypothetical protein